MARVRVTLPTRKDIATVLAWSMQHFGPAGRRRYESLVATALRDLAEDWQRPGSAARPELGGTYRTYHLRHSRARARTEDGIVRTPRHIVVYRWSAGDVLVVLRLLHDAMDVDRHVADQDSRD